MKFIAAILTTILVGCSSAPVVLVEKDPHTESRRIVQYDVSEFVKPLDLSKFRDIKFKTKQDGEIYVVFLEYNHAVLLIELIDTLKSEVDTRTDVILEVKKYYESESSAGHPEKDISTTP